MPVVHRTKTASASTLRARPSLHGDDDAVLVCAAGLARLEAEVVNAWVVRSAEGCHRLGASSRYPIPEVERGAAESRGQTWLEADDMGGEAAPGYVPIARTTLSQGQDQAVPLSVGYGYARVYANVWLQPRNWMADSDPLAAMPPDNSQSVLDATERGAKAAVVSLLGIEKMRIGDDDVGEVGQVQQDDDEKLRVERDTTLVSPLDDEPTSPDDDLNRRARPSRRRSIRHQRSYPALPAFPRPRLWLQRTPSLAAVV